MDKTFFIAADGDNMGSLIGKHILANDLEKAKRLSQTIHKGADAVLSYATKTWGGRVILSGGDDMLMEVHKHRFDPSQVAEMRALYKKVTGATLSVGVGHKASDASNALAYAKNTGKNKLVVWDDKLKPKLSKILSANLNKLRNKLRQQTGFK